MSGGRLIHRGLALGALLAMLTGCGGDDKAHPVGRKQAPAELFLCEDRLTRDEFVEFLDGNLIATESHYRNGQSAGVAIGEFALNLALNGIDFAKLGDYRATYKGGEYRFSDGEQGIGLRLYLTRDVGEYVAGSELPYSILDAESFVKNVRAKVVLDGLKSRVQYTYDKGPLFELVQGEIDFSGIADLEISIKLRLDLSLVAFEVDSTGVYFGSDEDRQQDKLTLRMKTTRATLASVVEQFRSGNFGYDLSDSRYDSVHYGIVQTFADSPFRMQNDDKGWYWEGNYTSAVEKAGRRYFQLGFASNRKNNYTEYFCDDARTQRIGIAEHNAGLFWGEFIFEDGTNLYYGIVPF